MRALLLLLVGLTGCAATASVGEAVEDVTAPVVDPVVSAVAAPSEDQASRFEAFRAYPAALDPSFTEAERAEVLAAVERWRSVSGGAMNVAIVPWGSDPNAVRVIRSATVPAYSIRWKTREVYVDVGVRSVKAMTLFLEGRLFGLPRVEGDVSIMNADDLAEDIQPSDVAMCRAHGRCV